MKFFALPLLFVGFLALGQSNAAAGSSHLLCYYDGASFAREGLSKLSLNDLEPALQFCTHLIYGFAGINPSSNKLVSNNEKLDLDIGSGLFRSVTGLKKKYPALKVLLGVGFDKDGVEEENTKYLTLLESSNARIPFINSAHSLVKTYGFDGLDLGWQFPKNKPKKVHSGIGSFWKGFKKIFTGDHIVDEKAEEHKEEFTALVRELRNAFRPDGYLLGVSVLPNVNSSLFYDIPALINNLDFVNLHAYDFHTPLRNPEVADFPNPIYEANERNPEFNINYQVQFWLNNHAPAAKINVGVPTFGRVWKLTKDSGLTGLPPVSDADSVGAAGLQTQTPGFYSWPEVCAKLPNQANQHLKGADGPLRKVGDPTKRFGNYAYRSADDKGENGLWVGYEDPDTAALKANFVKTRGLGGIALVDLSYDDFRGSCTGGEKYPILRATKYGL
ncbi:chitinase-like protein Idgf4 [Drosophila sulfurigaster albostrigata]|uniref:chitinase-like protein Idgf4 n=1 Tax=Drosophila sulfurigaster albostrigata TaxID=89887 RepID=UPI002D219201|nr:chitinase-like protein Idgf4 [Drosophila sulfurigaster albostrigata]